MREPELPQEPMRDLRRRFGEERRWRHVSCNTFWLTKVRDVVVPRPADGKYHGERLPTPSGPPYALLVVEPLRRHVCQQHTTKRAKVNSDLHGSGHREEIDLLLYLHEETVARLKNLLFLVVQQGLALAPQAVFIEDSGPAVRPFAAALDRALGRQLVALPPRTLTAGDAARLRSAREALVVRQALGEWVSVLSPVDRLVPIVAIEPLPVLTPSPLDRFVRISPAADGEQILSALRPVARHLQCVGLATGPGDDGPAFERQLARLGATRICPPGLMGLPSMRWAHDGMPCLSRLVRWCDVEQRAP